MMIKTYNSFHGRKSMSYSLWCEMLDQVQVQLLAEEEDEQQWWKDLSPEEQSKYLSDHPQSAKAKQIEKEKEEGESATSKSIKDLKDHVDSVSKSVGIDAKTVVKAFKQPSVFNTVNALGGSISAAAKTARGLVQGIGKTLNVGGAALTDTPGFDKLQKGMISFDQWSAKNPTAKKIAGVALAGAAVAQWWYMSFSGDVESDFDLASVSAAITGKPADAVPTLKDFLGTPEGVKNMGLLSVGVAGASLVGTTSAYAALGSNPVGLALALTYAGLKAAGETKKGKKVKAKMVAMGKEAKDKVQKGAKKIDKKIGRDDRNEGFSEMYTTIIEKDEHKKSVQYKKLAPRMKDAVDQIFKKMDAKPSDFLNSFEKTIVEVSKKFKVPEKKLMNYFEKEMLSV